MIQPKSATDEAIYKRYKDCPPGHDMRAFVEWYERGKKPQERSFPVHEAAREVLEQMQQEHKLKDIINHFDTYEALIRRLLVGDFSRVPDYKAKEIANYDGERVEPIQRVESEITDAQYRNAQRIIKEKLDGGASYTDLANLYNMDYRTLYKIAKDQYKKANPEALKVIQ